MTFSRNENYGLQVHSGLFRNTAAFNQSLSSWDIGNVSTMVNMLNNSGLSVANYDATLIGWATLNPGEIQIPSNITLDANGLSYCLAEEAKSILEGNSYSWIINDNGLDCSNAFITTWETSNANESITIPTTGAGYNYSVDWGDGTVETAFTGNATHQYTTAGEYVVKIIGDFPRIHFDSSGDKDKIQSIDQWGSIVWQSFQSAFLGCTKLTYNATDAPNLSQVKSIDRMFNDCNSFDATNLNNWDVSTVESMTFLFSGATVFNGMIDQWDVSKVAHFVNMFSNTAAFNQDISNWTINNNKNVTMAGMFASAEVFNQPIGKWDVSRVTSVKDMFLRAEAFDYSLASWDISNMTDMGRMLDRSEFSQASYDATLIGWATLENGETQIPINITLDTSTTYCLGTAARNILTSPTYNWIINDGGQSCMAKTAINVYLLGAALNPKTGEENLMRDDLRSTAVMPSNSPYPDAVRTTESVLTNTSSAVDTVVDWVWVELRDQNDDTIVIEGRSALLQRDGDVVDIDGVSPVEFTVASGTYYVVINHRNHLAIRSKDPIIFDGVPVPIDFSSSPSTIEGGLNAVTELTNGKYAMYAGDVDDNGQTQNSDINILSGNLGSSGYQAGDADMNGQIQNTDINSIVIPCIGKAVQF